MDAVPFLCRQSQFSRAIFKSQSILSLFVSKVGGRKRDDRAFGSLKTKKKKRTLLSLNFEKERNLVQYFSKTERRTRKLLYIMYRFLHSCLSVLQTYTYDDLYLVFFQCNSSSFSSHIPSYIHLCQVKHRRGSTKRDPSSVIDPCTSQQILRLTMESCQRNRRAYVP